MYAINRENSLKAAADAVEQWVFMNTEFSGAFSAERLEAALAAEAFPLTSDRLQPVLDELTRRGFLLAVEEEAEADTEVPSPSTGEGQGEGENALPW